MNTYLYPFLLIDINHNIKYIHFLKYISHNFISFHHDIHYYLNNDHLHKYYILIHSNFINMLNNFQYSFLNINQIPKQLNYYIQNIGYYSTQFHNYHDYYYFIYIISNLSLWNFLNMYYKLSYHHLNNKFYNYQCICYFQQQNYYPLHINFSYKHNHH